MCSILSLHFWGIKLSGNSLFPFLAPLRWLYFRQCALPFQRWCRGLLCKKESYFFTTQQRSTQTIEMRIKPTGTAQWRSLDERVTRAIFQPISPILSTAIFVRKNSQLRIRFMSWLKVGQMIGCPRACKKPARTKNSGWRYYLLRKNHSGS